MKIKVYTTPTCPYCQMTKDYLSSQKVDYEEENVQENLQARKEMVDISGQLGVPVISVNGKTVVGYDLEKINKILELPKK
jgi:glutaredoxin 3